MNLSQRMRINSPLSSAEAPAFRRGEESTLRNENSAGKGHASTSLMPAPGPQGFRAPAVIKCDRKLASVIEMSFID